MSSSNSRHSHALEASLPSALRLVDLGSRFFCAGAADALDRAARDAGFRRDLSVLLLDDTQRGRVALEAVKRGLRHPAVGALRAVFIHNVEEYKFADDP